MMKRVIIALVLSIGLLAPVALPAAASAVNVAPICNSSASGTEVCKDLKKGTGGQNPIIYDLKIALEIISIVAGFGAVVMIIIGGVKMTLSGGDPAAIKSGREMIIFALIGVVVVISAQTIVAFVLNKIG